MSYQYRATLFVINVSRVKLILELHIFFYVCTFTNTHCNLGAVKRNKWNIARQKYIIVELCQVCFIVLEILLLMYVCRYTLAQMRYSIFILSFWDWVIFRNLLKHRNKIYVYIFLKELNLLYTFLLGIISVFVKMKFIEFTIKDCIY